MSWLDVTYCWHALVRRFICVSKVGLTFVIFIIIFSIETHGAFDVTSFIFQMSFGVILCLLVTVKILDQVLNQKKKKKLLRALTTNNVCEEFHCTLLITLYVPLKMKHFSFLVVPLKMKRFLEMETTISLFFHLSYFTFSLLIHKTILYKIPCRFPNVLF